MQSMIIRATALAFAAAPIASTSYREFRLEAAHSEIGFTIGFLGHPVHGRFDDVAGTLVYVDGKPEASSITARIETASINTGSKHRDEHLRSTDFFGAEKFPVILFQSTIVVRRGREFVARGNLSMHGVTRVVTILFAETSPPLKDPHGSTLVYFKGSTKINRKDFGVLGGSAHNDWFDNIRSAALGDTVDVELEIEGWDVDYDRSPRYDAVLKKVSEDGVTKFLSRFREMYKANPDTLKNSEWEFDQVGRALLYKGRTADAIEVFKLSSEIFPKSASAQSALAHAYEVSGDKQRATDYVDRALALDPVDTRALEIRRRLRG